MYFVTYQENQGIGWATKNIIVDKHPLDWLVEISKLESGKIERTMTRLLFWSRLEDDIDIHRMAGYRRAIGMKFDYEGEEVK